MSTSFNLKDTSVFKLTPQRNPSSPGFNQTAIGDAKPADWETMKWVMEHKPASMLWSQDTHTWIERYVYIYIHNIDYRWSNSMFWYDLWISNHTSGSHVCWGSEPASQIETWDSSAASTRLTAGYHMEACGLCVMIMFFTLLFHSKRWVGGIHSQGHTYMYLLILLPLVFSVSHTIW